MLGGSAALRPSLEPQVGCSPSQGSLRTPGCQAPAGMAGHSRNGAATSHMWLFKVKLV